VLALDGEAPIREAEEVVLLVVDEDGICPALLVALHLEVVVSGNYSGCNTIPPQGPPTMPFQRYHLLFGGPSLCASQRIFMRRHNA
jgi:hypothetical protein